jgi:Cep192 domain 4
MTFLPRMALVLFVSVCPLAIANGQQLQCNPCGNNYGAVQIGASREFTFQLTNSGSSALTIKSRGRNTKNFFFRHFLLPVTLQPGQGTSVRVDFVPATTGTLAGTMTLRSNALNSPLRIAVSGTGTSASGLGISPTSLNFGNVTVGSSASQQLTLSAASSPVTISLAQVDSSEFTLPGFAPPITIAAGQSLAVTVKFTPNASGTATANLVLTSDAGNSPNTVPLTGVGVAVQPHSADLSWSASKDTVIGYNVYRGVTKGGSYVKINPVLDSSTNYTDSTVSGGTTYYYVATALDANGVESAYSNEVAVAIPSP